MRLLRETPLLRKTLAVFFFLPHTNLQKCVRVWEIMFCNHYILRALFADANAAVMQTISEREQQPTSAESVAVFERGSITTGYIVSTRLALQRDGGGLLLHKGGRWQVLGY